MRRFFKKRPGFGAAPRETAFHFAQRNMFFFGPLCSKRTETISSTYGVLRMKIYDYNGSKNICGQRVKEARKKCNLSQENLAAKLQLEGVIIERDSVSRIEIGTRFVADYEIAALCKILHVTPGYLLGME